MRLKTLALVSLPLLAAACSSHGKDLVVGGPVAPPAKPVVEPYVPAAEPMDDFLLAVGSNAVLFPTDSAQLDGRSRDTLDRQAAWLMTHRDLQIRIEGDADERASDSYNLRLGRRRAQAVIDYFVMKGLTRTRFEIQSFGKRKPVVARKGDVQINRRAVTVVLGDPSDDPSGTNPSGPDLDASTRR